MKMSKLSNQTNSQDPQAVNSRVFVGNLNTFQCSKADVERMFQRYGRLVGISMHKGYAFVQFTNPFDARNACHGEDGRTILGQVLDVNMVAEPKPHQIGRKRQNVTKTGNDWDYYYDSYCTSSLLQGNSPRPLKRQRLMTHQNRPGSKLNLSSVHHQQQQQQAAVVAAAIAAQAAVVQQANLIPQQMVLNQHGQSNHLVNSNGTNVNGLVAAVSGGQQCNGQHTSAIVSQATMNNFAKNFIQSSSISINKHQRQLTEQLQITTENLSSLVNCGDQNIITNGYGSNGIMQNGANGHCSPEQLLLQQQQQHHQQQQHQQQRHQQHQQQQLHHQQQQQQHQLQQLQNFQLNSQSLLDLQNQQQHLHQQQLQNQQEQQQNSTPYKIYSNPDTLICGNCRECFTELTELLDHKKSYCKLRFTCKCQESASPNSMNSISKNPLPSTKLLCAVCKDAFINPWDLMVHAQAAHMVNIYELGNEENNNNNGLISTPITITSTSTTNLDNNNNTITTTPTTLNGISTSIINFQKIESSTLNVQQQQQQPQQQTNLIIRQQQQQNQNLYAGQQHQPNIRSNQNLCNGNSGSEIINRICISDVVDNSLQQQLNNRLGVQSPDGFIIKEDNQSHHSDEISLDGRMSSASTVHQSDDIKINGSISSRDSSPILESQRSSCNGAILNIDGNANLNSPPTSIDRMTTNLAISLTANGTPVSI